MAAKNLRIVTAALGALEEDGGGVGEADGASGNTVGGGRLEWGCIERGGNEEQGGGETIVTTNDNAGQRSGVGGEDDDHEDRREQSSIHIPGGAMNLSQQGSGRPEGSREASTNEHPILGGDGGGLHGAKETAPPPVSARLLENQTVPSRGATPSTAKCTEKDCRKLATLGALGGIPEFCAQHSTTGMTRHGYFPPGEDVKGSGHTSPPTMPARLAEEVR